MFFLFLFRVRLSSFKLAIPSLMSCVLYLKLSSVMLASPPNMFRDSSSMSRKTKAHVKQHDAEINTGFVTTTTSFSRLNSRDGNSRGYILSRRQPQQSPAETSIVATTQPSSSIIFLVLSRAGTLLSHNLFVENYIVPVLEDGSLGTDRERIFPRLVKKYIIFCYLCTLILGLFLRLIALYSFTWKGFVPMGFPCQGFNEATYASPTPHHSISFRDVGGSTIYYFSLFHFPFMWKLYVIQFI